MSVISQTIKNVLILLFKLSSQCSLRLLSVLFRYVLRLRCGHGCKMLKERCPVGLIQRCKQYLNCARDATKFFILFLGFYS